MPRLTREQILQGIQAESQQKKAEQKKAAATEQKKRKPPSLLRPGEQVGRQQFTSSPF